MAAARSRHDPWGMGSATALGYRCCNSLPVVTDSLPSIGWLSLVRASSRARARCVACVAEYRLDKQVFVPAINGMKILLVLVLLQATPLLANPATCPLMGNDIVFDKLELWAVAMEKQGREWDSNCVFGPEIDQAKCERVLGALKPQWAKFIELAGQYHSNGADCRAALRQRWIGMRIQQFALNLRYVGIRDTSRPSAEFSVLKNRNDLMAEIKKCTGK